MDFESWTWLGVRYAVQELKGDSYIFISLHMGINGKLRNIFLGNLLSSDWATKGFKRVNQILSIISKFETIK